MARMSNAERQKKYRERKKAKEGEKFLQKESKRVQRYYVSTTELPTRKLLKRREKIRECMKRMRKRPNSNKNEVNSNSEVASCSFSQRDSTINDDPCDSTVHDDVLVQAPEPSKLTVKLDFKQPRKEKKRKASSQLYLTKKKLKLMNEKVENLQRRNSCLRKRLHRLASKTKTPRNDKATPCTESNDQKEAELTPKSRAKAEVREMNMTPSTRKKVLKKLEFQNCLLQEVKTSVNSAKGKQSQRPLLSVLCGKIMHKYKMERQLGKYTCINRKQIQKTRKSSSIRKTRNERERNSLREKVRAFMERDDNSTNLPGKKDSKKIGKERYQKRVLNDYLYNLHLKFKAENSTSNISLSVFSRLRPSYVQLVHFRNRKTCLCQKHQNMVLKCKALRDYKVLMIDNPDALVEKLNDNDIADKIDDITDDVIKFSEWRRVTVEKKGRVFKRMQIVNVEEEKEKFRQRMVKELGEFREHIRKVKIQYEQSRKLKNELPIDHVICHMDFAENYICTFAEEVQSAYFDKGTVTLHPVVIYSNNTEGNDEEVEHRSFVIVSDETAHTATTVFACMKAVVKEVQNIMPECKMIHYMTDSPTSQYRNKQIFSVIANHDKIFPGVKASWLYFEAGHGKGPCDGVGGTAKRLADMAVKRQSVVIQSAEDFYSWGKSQENSRLKYLFVSRNMCIDVQKELDDIAIKPVKGTLQLHAVVPLDKGRIAVRDTSCFCESCFNGGKFTVLCPGWSKPTLQYCSAKNTSTETENELEKEQLVPDESIIKPGFAIGSYVAALYDKQWYMGKILEYDENDQEYFVSFMVAGKKSYKWPDKPDTIWIQEDDILSVVREPLRLGKTRNTFKFLQDDIDNVESLYGN